MNLEGISAATASESIKAWKDRRALASYLGVDAVVVRHVDSVFGALFLTAAAPGDYHPNARSLTPEALTDALRRPVIPFFPIGASVP